MIYWQQLRNCHGDDEKSHVQKLIRLAELFEMVERNTKQFTLTYECWCQPVGELFYELAPSGVGWKMLKSIFSNKKKRKKRNIWQRIKTTFRFINYLRRRNGPANCLRLNPLSLCMMQTKLPSGLAAKWQGCQVL